jgi:hypothetical protein
MEEIYNTEKLVIKCYGSENESDICSEFSDISSVLETKKSYKYLKKQDECEKKVILYPKD